MAETKLTTWKKNKQHEVTLPSGTKVTIQIPNLPLLIKAGQIPNKLLDIVTKAQSGTIEITPELIAEQADYTAFIVTKTVVDPVISEEDIPELPYEDVECVMDFAMRNRDLDAVGHHISGLEQVDSFRRFRGLDVGDEIGSGL